MYSYYLFHLLKYNPIFNLIKKKKAYVEGGVFVLVRHVWIKTLCNTLDFRVDGITEFLGY